MSKHSRKQPCAMGAAGRLPSVATLTVATALVLTLYQHLHPSGPASGQPGMPPTEVHGEPGERSTAAGIVLPSVQQRIPPTIHQVMGFYDNWRRPANWTAPKDMALPPLRGDVVEAMQSWVDMNPGWQYRIWDQHDFEELLKKYPQYQKAWDTLPKAVERADMARYLILYDQGGVYADSDVHCQRPMSAVLRPTDRFVAIWEDASSRDNRHEWDPLPMVICQWWFASAPAHPSLLSVLDRIKQHAGKKLYDDSVMDTIARTGPGAFTQAVSWAAFNRSQDHNSSTVRILPRLAGGWWGDVSIVQEPFINHIFSSTWKSQPRAEAVNASTAMYRLGEEPFPYSLLHTEVAFNPPYALVHQLPGECDRYQGVDVCAAVAKWGLWQPNNMLSWPPTLLNSFLEGLPSPGSAPRTPVVVDVGAGYGLFSLSAAARGYKVVAFEAATRSAAALQASIELNGFGHLMRLEAVALGETNQTICLDERQLQPEQNGKTEREGVMRGYGPDEGHGRVEGCQQVAQRVNATQAVLDALPEGSEVAAVRVSANLWSGRLVQALLPLLEQHSVRTLQMEWSQPGANSNLVGLLQQLIALGFTEVQHQGPICAARWPCQHLKGRDGDDKIFTPNPQFMQAGQSCRLAPTQLKHLKSDYLKDADVEVFLLRRPPCFTCPSL